MQTIKNSTSLIQKSDGFTKETSDYASSTSVSTELVCTKRISTQELVAPRLLGLRKATARLNYSE